MLNVSIRVSVCQAGVVVVPQTEIEMVDVSSKSEKKPIHRVRYIDDHLSSDRRRDHEPSEYIGKAVGQTFLNAKTLSAWSVRFVTGAARSLGESRLTWAVAYKSRSISSGSILLSPSTCDRGGWTQAGGNIEHRGGTVMGNPDDSLGGIRLHGGLEFRR